MKFNVFYDLGDAQIYQNLVLSILRIFAEDDMTDETCSIMQNQKKESNKFLTISKFDEFRTT